MKALDRNPLSSIHFYDISFYFFAFRIALDSTKCNGISRQNSSTYVFANFSFEFGQPRLIFFYVYPRVSNSLKYSSQKSLFLSILGHEVNNLERPIDYFFFLPFQYISLATQIFQFMNQHLIGSRSSYVREYVINGLVEQQMVILAAIIRDLDHETARTETGKFRKKKRFKICSIEGDS